MKRNLKINKQQRPQPKQPKLKCIFMRNEISPLPDIPTTVHLIELFLKYQINKLPPHSQQMIQ